MTERSSTTGPTLAAAACAPAPTAGRALRAGWQVLPWTATLFVVAPPVGRFGDRMRERPRLTGGLLLAAVPVAVPAAVGTR